MANAFCAGCGARTTPGTQACPYCGTRRRRSRLPIVAAVLGGFIALHFGLSLITVATGDESTSPAPVVAAAAPAPDPAAEERVKTAVRIATLIKTGLRDPDSLTWQRIRVSDDASVVCLEYRAKNGFGGLKLERTTYAGGRLSSESWAWNKNCAAKKLFDLDHLRHSL